MLEEAFFLIRLEKLRKVANSLYGEYVYNSGIFLADTRKDLTDLAKQDEKGSYHMYNILMLLDQVTKEFQMAQGRKFEDEE